MKKIITLLCSLFFMFGFSQSQDVMLAENYYRNNEFEKALEYYKKLTKRSPYTTKYLERLISCYQETDKYGEAEKFLNQSLEKRPKLIYYNVLLGSNFDRQNKKEKAKLFYGKAVSSMDKNPSYGPTIAKMFKDLNKLDFAIAAYRKSSELNKNQNYDFQIAQLYGEKGDFQKMFDAYIYYLDKNPDNLHYVKRYAGIYVTDDAENENNILFKKALLKSSASNPKDQWNDLLAWLFIKQKDYNKAFIQLKALNSRYNGSLSSIIQLAKIAFNNKDYDSSKLCFDFIINKTEDENKKIEAISYNLMIAVEKKQPDVKTQFNTAFEKYGINRKTLPIQLAYAKYLAFNENNSEEAKKILEKALELSGSRYARAEVKLSLGDVLVYQNKFNKALIYFSQVQSKFPNHYLGQEARFKVAQTSYFKSDFKWAKAQLKVLKAGATQLIANDAADLFLTISDNQPKDSIPTGLKKYSKANLLAFQNRNDEAINILKDILLSFKGQKIEDEALYSLAELYVKKNKIEDAVLTYEKIVVLDKEGILADDSLYKLAELYSKKDNVEKAKEYYERIVLEYPSSIYLVDARKKYRKLRGDKINN